jgi:hypothetical protein
MYFPELIECPECGFHTHELRQYGEVVGASTNLAKRGVTKHSTLMCDACWEDVVEDTEGILREPSQQDDF